MLLLLNNLNILDSMAEGHSIERYPANIDTDTNSDWVDQIDPNPGIVSLPSILQ